MWFPTQPSCEVFSRETPLCVLVFPEEAQHLLDTPMFPPPLPPNPQFRTFRKCRNYQHIQRSSIQLPKCPLKGWACKRAAAPPPPSPSLGRRRRPPAPLAPADQHPRRRRRHPCPAANHPQPRKQCSSNSVARVRGPVRRRPTRQASFGVCFFAFASWRLPLPCLRLLRGTHTLWSRNLVAGAPACGWSAESRTLQCLSGSPQPAVWALTWGRGT